jgi:hypothetical protein
MELVSNTVKRLAGSGPENRPEKGLPPYGERAEGLGAAGRRAAAAGRKNRDRSGQCSDLLLQLWQISRLRSPHLPRGNGTPASNPWAI